MKNLNFINYQEEISINQFKANKHLNNFELNIEELTLEEKLLIVVLDRDGYFFTDQKPSPDFLIFLKKNGIYVQAFSFFSVVSKTYGCFLKTFINMNPGKTLKSFYIE